MLVRLDNRDSLGSLPRNSEITWNRFVAADGNDIYKYESSFRIEVNVSREERVEELKFVTLNSGLVQLRDKTHLVNCSVEITKSGFLSGVHSVCLKCEYWQACDLGAE